MPSTRDASQRESFARLQDAQGRIADLETKEYPVADAAGIAASAHGATLDTTPLDADEVPTLNSAASFALIRTTWTSIKAFLLTYFSTLFAVLAGTAGGQTIHGGTAANEDLTLQGTIHATRTTSYVLLQPTEGKVAIGPVTTPLRLLHGRQDVNGSAGMYFENGTSGTAAAAEIGLKNAGGDTATFGITSALTTAYGALLAREAYLYHTQNLVLMVDSATGAIKFAVGSGGPERMRLDSTGLGIGTTASQGKLHVHDGTTGFLVVSKTGIVGAAVTLVPDATGDVITGVVIHGVAKNTTPGAAKVDTALIAPGGTADVVIGADTLRFAVSAGGAVTVIRQAGSASWTIGVTLTWL